MTRDLPEQGAVFGEFATAQEAQRAFTMLWDAGHDVETYSPFPLSQAESEQRPPWLLLGVATFVIASGAGMAAYLVQWYANTHSYPLNIGGRPTNAVLAFVVPTVETIILAAGLTAVAVFLIALRLPRLWRPFFEIQDFARVTQDRYWISIAIKDEDNDVAQMRAQLESFKPLRVLHAKSVTHE
jgi:hypothetical protein